jgi:hypothetical protein
MDMRARDYRMKWLIPSVSCNYLDAIAMFPGIELKKDFSPDLRMRSDIETGLLYTSINFHHGKPHSINVLTFGRAK